MPGSAASRFRTTSWSLVLAAADRPTADSRKALSKLCEVYWNPVYAFIRRSGHSPDQAQDLTQGFFALLLEKNYLQAADRKRGRFRSFLLTAVKHFLANEWDRANALKRGGGQVPVSIDPVQAEKWYGPSAVEESTPETAFERRWALSLLDHVMSQLRASYSASGREEQCEMLMSFLNRESDDPRYKEVAAALGLSTEALRMKVHRMRRKYRQLLRSEIAETVSKTEDIDEEIKFLMSVLSG